MYFSCSSTETCLCLIVTQLARQDVADEEHAARDPLEDTPRAETLIDAYLQFAGS